MVKVRAWLQVTLTERLKLLFASYTLAGDHITKENCFVLIKIQPGSNDDHKYQREDEGSKINVVSHKPILHL